MVGAQCEVQADQLLGTMLNRPIASLLDAGVLTMAGVQDGLVAVKHDNPAAAQRGVKSQLYFFDEDGLLKKSTAEIEQQKIAMEELERSSAQVVTNAQANAAAQEKAAQDTERLNEVFAAHAAAQAAAIAAVNAAS